MNMISGISSRSLNTTKGPRRELTLCEFLAHGGGLPDNGGDLRAMGADDWHRAAPFRARLVNNDDGGVSLDTAARLHRGASPQAGAQRRSED